MSEISIPAPTALRSLTLATPDLIRSVAFYTRWYGLVLDIHADQSATLTGANGGPALLLVPGDDPTLRALGFVFDDVDRLESAMLAHERAGRPIERTSGGFAIHDPAGLRLDFAFDDQFAALNSQTTPTDRPIFVSHVVLNARDPIGARNFYESVVGLIQSDRYERDLLTFLRADQPQHHCVGIAAADVDGLNHFAMDCGNVDGVMRGMSRLAQHGSKPFWGPGRHGPGGNIFCYFADPDGFVAEYTCDVMQISGDEHHPKEWARTPENGNLWGTGGPTRQGAALMAGNVHAEFAG